MQPSLQTDANSDFLHDFNKISTKVEECGENDLLSFFFYASVKRHSLIIRK